MGNQDSGSGGTTVEDLQLLHISGVRYPKPVGKRIELRNGQLFKTVLPRPSRGVAINRMFGTFEDYCTWRDTLDPQDMLLCGTFAPEVESGTTVVYSGRESDGAISATNGYLDMRDMPTVARIDVDSKQPDEVQGLWPVRPGAFRTQEALVDTLLQIVPELDACAMRVSDSSGSMIYGANGMLLKGAGGMRIEVPVANGRVLVSLLEGIHGRCWEHGIGAWAFIDKAGRFHDRSLADQVMTRPHQPDFLVPDLRAGLERRARLLTIRGNVLAEEIEFDRTAAQQRMAAAKTTLRPEAEAAMATLLESRIEAGVRRGLRRPAAELIARAAIEGDELLDSQEVILGNGSVLTVGQLLDQGATADRLRLRDPTEPDYRGGEACAVFVWRDGNEPAIVSYAHGQKWYRLTRGTVPRGPALWSRPRDQRQQDALRRLAKLAGGVR